jgi:hypothetical protein|tara:strand:+ start:1082 stop:1501 length:420 start_codon:yes stop_codon:yes gene_type:complete
MAINKMNNISLLYNLKRWLIGALAILMTLSCTQDIENLVGPSFSGYTIGITAQYGGVGIVKASGSATIRVEVVTAAGVPVNGATVILTSTLGTLAAATFVTVNGTATTSLAAGAVAGAAYVVATVENASATTMVPILSF